MRKLSWLLLVGITVLAVPAQAVFWDCDEICVCSLSCTTLCRPAENHPLTTCGALGLDCIQNCGSSADLAPASSCAPAESEAPLFAPPAPAEAAPQPTR